MSSEEQYREAAREVLRAAGWVPGRTSGATAEARLVADYGPPHRAARDFLAEFGGLRLMFANPRMSEADTDVEVVPPQTTGWVDVWSGAAGEPLYPVGQFAGGNCVLLSGESGALYGAFDAELGRLGANALEGLGRLVLDPRPLEPRLPVPPEVLFRREFLE
ncbi:SUKH-3 domain-containing protein [Streptomyces sp. TLI_146]|uniref:SUKH-3 domain-containing protein n=1 Tax=Streptomyces sp. TLI_146 TaxID=1938858 RepID=UPI000C7034ED|nr:SUKH-3 domain-containing protein [Streptomyces sp. TLI_146]PKV86158.1 SUKH-3 immunity protein of toxin-antitoxin system [Streptomyces sp. TLI_146]